LRCSYLRPIYKSDARSLFGALAACLLAFVACAGARGPAGSLAEKEDPRAAPDLDRYQAAFELRWRDQPIGWAEETLAPSTGGYRFERRERWRIARDGVQLEAAIRIAIDTDRELEPVRIEVLGGEVDGVAHYGGEDWRITGDEARRIEGIPLELLALRLARTGEVAWRGPVLWAGLGFAGADAVVEPTGERRRVVTILGAAGALVTHVELRADGTVERAVGPEVSAHRVSSAPGGAGAMPASPPDLIAWSALEIAGARPVGPDLVIEIESDAPLPSPPRVPGQRIAATRSGWRAELGGEGAALVAPPALVALALEVSGAFGPTDEASAAHPAARGRTDCVGHSLLFAARAGERGWPVRLVTGYQLDGARLVRHAWALVELDGRWIPVDPTSGEAPVAPGRHLAIAVHGSARHEVALAAELAYAGLANARARFSDWRRARTTPRTP
jgi:hypothetical protein